VTRLLRSAFVIARRDFAATVLSKTFIFFLIGPMLPWIIAGLFLGVSAKTESHRQRPVVAVLAPQQQFDQLETVRDRLVEAVGDNALPALQRFQPERDIIAQQKRLLANNAPPVVAVLTTSAAHARLTGAISRDDPTVRGLQLLLEQQGAPAKATAPAIEVVQTGHGAAKIAADRSGTARGGQFLLFFLTLLLATMLLSQVIEEKSNKIIEVIAAAVPMEAMFIGKLFAMLAASLVGLVVWVSVGALAAESISARGLSALAEPAVGWPVFVGLTALYFTMNYLVLGALFLSIGAQASSPREVQTMSMPITVLQVMIFGLASASIGQSDGPLVLAAAAFPLSSPMVMVARAAEQPQLWPHLIAFVWQALWVGVLLKIGARFFRSRVLKSGPAGGLFRRSART
jgi:ABC-2 type transport system permease protein